MLCNVVAMLCCCFISCYDVICGVALRCIWCVALCWYVVLYCYAMFFVLCCYAVFYNYSKIYASLNLKGLKLQTQP